MLLDNVLSSLHYVVENGVSVNYKVPTVLVSETEMVPVQWVILDKRFTTFKDDVYSTERGLEIHRCNTRGMTPNII